MDESEQRKMADGLVCGLVLKKAVDLETKAKIESLEEENNILCMPEEIKQRTFYRLSILELEQKLRLSNALVEEARDKADRTMDKLKLSNDLNERYLNAIEEAIILLSHNPYYALTHGFNVIEALEILRVASFATMPESDNDTKSD